MSHDRNETDARENFSGRFSVRVPTSLHRALFRVAKTEGVSLNHFVTVAIARAVGPEMQEYKSPGDRAFEEIWGDLSD
jgi:predicted HicB family RNase H-like nuclease